MMMSWLAEHEGAVGGERELRAARRGLEVDAREHPREHGRVRGRPEYVSR